MIPTLCLSQHRSNKHPQYAAGSLIFRSTRPAPPGAASRGRDGEKGASGGSAQVTRLPGGIGTVQTGFSLHRCSEFDRFPVYSATQPCQAAQPLRQPDHSGSHSGQPGPGLPACPAPGGHCLLHNDICLRKISLSLSL